MGDTLTTLKAKAQELELELSQNPLFKNLEAIRLTISLFENGISENGSERESKLIEIPKEYKDDLNWREKILVALGKLKVAAPVEIVSELKRLGEKQEEVWLHKRVSVMLSYMKRKKILGVKTVGGKTKYFIK